MTFLIYSQQVDIILMNNITVVHTNIKYTVFHLCALVCLLKSLPHYDTACLFFRILSPCQSHPVTSVCTNIEHYTTEKAENTCFQIFLHLIRCDFMSWMCVQINILIYIRLSRQLSFTFLFIPVYNNPLARLHIRNIMAQICTIFLQHVAIVRDGKFSKNYT